MRRLYTVEVKQRKHQGKYMVITLEEKTELVMRMGVEYRTGKYTLDDLFDLAGNILTQRKKQMVYRISISPAEYIKYPGQSFYVIYKTKLFRVIGGTDYSYLNVIRWSGNIPVVDNLAQ
jgi:hypothetical protein